MRTPPYLRAFFFYGQIQKSVIQYGAEEGKVMKIYTFEMLYKDMPRQLGNIRYNNMFCDDDDETDIQPFIYINNICIFCDNSDLVYIPVSEFGPVIVVNFLLDGNLAANFILHIDDEIIVDNEIITFILMFVK